ncbi:MAG: hypothetical protein JXA57_11075 [Armatimonadetes bacterium]|nr:hypothetical protein [Armatimonadota bacterium]
MGKRVWLTLAIAVILTVAVAGSSVLAETNSGPSIAPDSSGPPPEMFGDFATDRYPYIYEGIPQPTWDSTVDGWYRYLGDGHFTSEFGRDFYWRDGRFVNADGTLMELPPSARDHLNSLGVYSQPTDEDVARFESFRGLSTPSVDAAAESPIVMASLSVGSYLHVGKTTTDSMGYFGNQAYISVFDRSPGYYQYYGIGLKHAGGYGYMRCGLEFCNLSYSTYYYSYWVPTIHSIINGVDYQYGYASYLFVTTPHYSQNHTLKLAVKSSGYIWPYYDNYNLAYDVDKLYWGTQARGYGETAYEIGSDDPYNAPHDPANHHSVIKLQTSIGGGWSYQTGSVWMYNKVKRVDGSVFSDGVYNSNWIISPNYDWMARPL